MSPQKSTDLTPELAQRIESEKTYHEEFYRQHKVSPTVSFDLATSAERKPHNLYWAYYDTILHHFHGDIVNKKILVVGCGSGSIAMNLAKNNAKVDAFDVCEEAIAVCKRRAEFNGIDNVNFFVSSSEELELATDQYDAVVGEMILHHLDIPISIEKFHQLLRPGGLGVFAEWKVYAVIDRIRSLAVLRRLFPPGGKDGYATEHERKLSREDFRTIQNRFPNMRLDYRYCIRGKLDYFLGSHAGAKYEKWDFRLLRCFPFLSPFTDGVIIRFTKE